jgi:predicted regulator of Ras-like GTPase activity (Roadblock/LC7/MglB family)
MIGTKGFRAREAAANYKRRERRLVSDEVRAARFANLHGNESAPKAAAVDADAEKAALEAAAAEAAAAEVAEQAAGEQTETVVTEGAATKTTAKKAGKAKDKAEK